MQQRRAKVFPVFLLFFFIALILFFLSQKGLLNGPDGILEQVTIPLQRMFFALSHSVSATTNNNILQHLRDENQTLAKQLVAQTELEKENAALRDQFQTRTPSPATLIPAHVIGMIGFVPGVSMPSALLIDQGTASHLKKGDAVVVRNNLVGTLSEVSARSAKVALLTQGTTSFTAQTLHTSALGIIKPENDALVLENVVLSDKLQIGDLVFTKGDMTDTTQIPPGLVVGKITSVNRESSSLFQTAQVESLVDVSGLEMVFVITK